MASPSTRVGIMELTDEEIEEDEKCATDSTRLDNPHAVQSVGVSTEYDADITDRATCISDQKDADTCSSSTSVSLNHDDGVNTDDLYTYLGRQAFSSEIFKIEICNLPKNTGYSHLKKKLTRLKLNPVKIKGIPKASYAFVNFRSEDERINAIQIINGYEWNGKKLQAKVAKPRADPIAQKRRQEKTKKVTDCDEIKKSKTGDEQAANIPINERIKDVITPLWRVPYAEQLKQKQSEIVEVIRKLTNNIKKHNPSLAEWLRERKSKLGGLCCGVEDIKPSPIQEGYRNKCEFTIGKHPETQERTVGFRLGRYTTGICAVAEPNDCSNIPQIAKNIAQCMQDFVRGSSYDVYDVEDNTGHWRLLLVRNTTVGEVMAVVGFHPQDLNQELVTEEMQRLKKYFISGEGKQCNLTSLYFQEQTALAVGGIIPGQALKLLHGEEHITESLLGMKFRISPGAFFQVNTAAAEVLYTTIGDWCDITDNTHVFDVCCGTGTIGISLVKTRGVKKCVAIEMNEEATNNAKFNANLNDVSDKIEFHCDKAEAVLPDIMRRLSYSHVSDNIDTVAVVDPPRAGLHSKVVQALRNNAYLDRFVYVACNPRSALANFTDFVRPQSNRLKGKPFLPVKAVAVDLFPHTPHCELVVLFKR